MEARHGFIPWEALQKTKSRGGVGEGNRGKYDEGGKVDWALEEEAKAGKLKDVHGGIVEPTPFA